jgi:homoserine kinase type II
MAFYTSLDHDELAALLTRFGINDLSSCEGASDGIENSNYFLEAGQSQWILTLFEDLKPDELPFFIDLMQWLFAQRLPVAHPLQDNDGQTLHSLSGKPALLFPRLPGKHVTVVSEVECAAIGRCLGKLHYQSRHYPGYRDNARGTPWMEHAQQRLVGLLSDDDAVLLAEQIANARYLRQLDLPRGIIHGDLFRDNALFTQNTDFGNELSGIIDFYNACSDVLLLDLAIAVNDWCSSTADNGLNPALTRSLVNAYIAERTIETDEAQHWQAILQLAASRFWVSRLLAEKLPQRVGVLHAHKPSEEYRQRLLYHKHHITQL